MERLIFLRLCTLAPETKMAFFSYKDLLIGHAKVKKVVCFF